MLHCLNCSSQTLNLNYVLLDHGMGTAVDQGATDFQNTAQNGSIIRSIRQLVSATVFQYSLSLLWFLAGSTQGCF